MTCIPVVHNVRPATSRYVARDVQKGLNISDTILTLNAQWRYTPPISQLLDDLSLKVQIESQLVIILPIMSHHSRQSRCRLNSLWHMKFYSLHTRTFELIGWQQQKSTASMHIVIFRFGDCDSFVPLSFSRLWTVQTSSDATITLSSQLNP